MRNDEIARHLAVAWARRAGRDPATLLVEGASPFRVGKVSDTLVITSHVTGSSYELALPASDETLEGWLDTVVGHDVNSYQQHPD